MSDTTPATTTTTRPDTAPKGAAVWRRALAFAFDTTLIGVVAYGLGTLLFDLMISLGPVTRLIGLALAVAYFAVSDSVITGGRSLGKRALKIAVVDADGKPLSIHRAAERALIVMTPLLLNELPTGRVTTVVTVGWAVMFLGLGTSIIYLIVFNTPSRRSLHDLAVGATVIPADGTLPATTPLRTVHWLAIAGLTTFAFVTGLMMPSALHRGDMAVLATVREEVRTTPGAREALVLRTDVTRPGTQTREQVLAVTVFFRRMPENAEETARAVADTVIRRFPEVVGTEKLIVNVAVAWNLGVASYVKQHRLETSVSAWPKYEYNPA